VPAGPGVKFNPSFVSADEVGYVRKMWRPGSTTPAGRKGRKAMSDPRRGHLTASASRFIGGRRRRRPNWLKTFSRNPNYELTLTGICRRTTLPATSS
jgi:hypothetical protein